MITSGRPILFVCLAPSGADESEVVTTAEDMRKLANWMLTAADMADEAHAYLPHRVRRWRTTARTVAVRAF